MFFRIDLIFRCIKSLGVLLTLSVILSISSTQVVVEECSVETASQQVEWVMARRSARRSVETKVAPGKSLRHHRPLASCSPIQNPFFAVCSERANLNGSGSHLII